MKLSTPLAVGLLAGLVIAPVQAENWAHWRGPAFDGSSPEKNLPASWTQEKNIAWAVDLPGTSAATPIIHGDRILLSSTHKEKENLHALCLDRKTGQLLWSHKVSDDFSRDVRSTFSGPSPVTDGKHAIFFYGNGALACFDMEGQPLWARNLQKDYGDFAFQWTFSTSPTLYDGKLIMQILQRNEPVHGLGGKPGQPPESFIEALDPHTGKRIWRVLRPSQAKAESLEAFSTPIPFEGAGRREILVVGGDDLTGHDPATGRELWRWGTWNEQRIGHWRLVPSPVAGGGVILACAPKREPIFAVKAGATGRAELAWNSEESRVLSSDVPTPAFYDGDFFVLSDVRNAISRADAKTGTVKWSVELNRFLKWRASPTVADGKVYLMNHGGECVVLDAADGRKVHEVKMGDEGDDYIRSSIAVSQGQLFIRTNSKLYCVGRSPRVAGR